MNSELLDQPFAHQFIDAPAWKRAANYVLDLAFITASFFGFLFALGFGTGLADPTLPEKLEEHLTLLTLLWITLYYIGSESLFKGRTPAKFITKTMAVGPDGSRLTAKQVLLRNLGRFIPLDNLSYVFMDQGFHDLIAKTRVVNWQKTTQW
jgi:uncharacterized RDD family membrane protein YckC